MPRNGSRKRSGKFDAAARAPRERTEPVRRRPGGAVDSEALQLRETGASYSAIARHLELRRATDAHHAFVRALHALPDADRARVTGHEEDRLDLLETRIRDRDAAQPEKVERRLHAVGQLRAALAR
ncbi:MAG TPA: hypothetical protein VGL60_01435 [Acidimicrobiales bacterium]